jgi:1-deoxy-D-xylulose-5-phosphate reductoisomerase
MQSTRIIILGATGSIGTSSFEVLRNLNKKGERFRIVGLSCLSNTEELLRRAGEFGVDSLAASDPGVQRPEIRWSGEDAVLHLIEETEADIVINGIAGSPGLMPSLRALERGMDLALANKETVVMAGPIMFETARRTGASVIPVDSEHSALFHLLDGRKREQVRRLIITASGGAFRQTPLEEFPRLGVADALAHPTWDMGAKITIDSASMANKGLEVIEAHRLFDMGADEISVVIHPQSTVHSFIETVDGSLYAQLSAPDMKIPIQNALTYPELSDSPFGGLSFDELQLSFSRPEPARYPMLPLAYDTIRSEGPLPIVYNAANEIAVEAFMSGTIPFTGIAETVEATLSQEWDSEVPSTVEETMSIHRKAERRAGTHIAQRKERT